MFPLLNLARKELIPHEMSYKISQSLRGVRSVVFQLSWNSVILKFSACCWGACQISKWFEHFHTLDFETLWDLTVRCLMRYWIGPQLNITAPDAVAPCITRITALVLNIQHKWVRVLYEEIFELLVPSRLLRIDRKCKYSVYCYKWYLIVSVKPGQDQVHDFIYSRF